MKKLMLMLLTVTLCLSSFSGCQIVQTEQETVPPNVLLPLDEHEKLDQPFDEQQSMVGVIEEKPYPNVLTVRLNNWQDIENWGERVCVLIDGADEWCVNDLVRVYYSRVERPYDSTQSVRIIADRVEAYEWPAPEKPIIYFYPTVPTECSVKVAINGSLTCTYPDHGVDGWQNFTAYPDGTLTFPDGKEYYALYWEGVQYGEWDFSQGFCVRGEDTATFLEWALAAQGLTPREANEFIVYWLPLMQENAYNVISFQGVAYTDGAALEISPAPDSLLRVFMAYYASDKPVELLPQSFVPFERQGFAVVEWGGSEVSAP